MNYKWVQKGEGEVGCMLLDPPYTEVVVLFGNVEVESNMFRFDWCIEDTGNSNPELLSPDNENLNTYLRSIVYDRLCQMGILHTGVQDEFQE